MRMCSYTLFVRLSVQIVLIGAMCVMNSSGELNILMKTIFTRLLYFIFNFGRGSPVFRYVFSFYFHYNSTYTIYLFIIDVK